MEGWRRTLCTSAAGNAAWAAAALLVCAFASGCIWNERYVATPQFSPDGRWVAWSFPDMAMHGLPGSNYLEACFAWRYRLGWCHPDRPRSRTVIDVDVGSEDLWALGVGVCLKWSPDSRRLAVVRGLNGVMVVDLATERTWRVSPAGEVITSAAWCGPNEIVYVAHTHIRGDNKERSDRTLWRVRVDPPGPRRPVFAEKDVRTLLSEYRPLVESLSPDGRWLVLLTAPPDGRVQVRDTATGKLYVPPQRPAKTEHRWSAWRPDSSAVLCVSGVQVAEETDDEPAATRYEALLIDPSRRKTLDISDRFTAAFGEGGPSCLVGPAWTPDGQYVVTKTSRNDCLVRLEPWEVIPVGRMQVEAARGVLVCERWDLHHLPVPGRMWAVLSSRQVAMTDYFGRQLAHCSIPRLPDNYKLTFSPDARYVVVRDTWYRGLLRITPLKWTPVGGYGDDHGKADAHRNSCRSPPNEEHADGTRFRTNAICPVKVSAR